MKPLLKITGIMFLTVITISSQTNPKKLTVYEIPFASKGNTIELELVNNDGIQTKDMSVKAIDKPEWVEFKNTSILINKNNLVEFEFDIIKEAPVGEGTSLKFLVGNENETFGEKEIRIAVAAPVNYELYQNYPNPFNPATTISYQLPKVSKINLKIYDILGSEVETLIDKEQYPGFYKLDWNAGRYSSGMYIYQLIAENNNGGKNIFRKKMLLIK